MKDPINTESLSDILDIVENEIDEELPRGDIQNAVLRRNRKFYREATSDEIDRNFLVKIMSLQKLAEQVGRGDLSDELVPALEIVEGANDQS